MAVDRDRALREATSAAARAIELDGTDALGYALRGYCTMLCLQFDRYSEAFEDVQLAHKLNPNDMFVLGTLAWTEVGVGEHERALEHCHQIMRLSPRDSRTYEIYHLMGVASFVGRQYREGIQWALRAVNDKPEMLQPRNNLVNCYVGANEIAKARAAFAAAQTLAPEYVRSRLAEGAWWFGRPEDRKRAHTFFRIAAGLEDPSAADTLR
jgi:tetratricopeptide (TPR) repeat protein